MVKSLIKNSYRGKTPLTTDIELGRPQTTGVSEVLIWQQNIFNNNSFHRVGISFSPDRLCSLKRRVMRVHNIFLSIYILKACDENALKLISCVMTYYMKDVIRPVPHHVCDNYCHGKVHQRLYTAVRLSDLRL